MRLTDILRPQCVKVPLEARDKQQAIFELVDLLADAEHIDDRDDLRTAVWKREQTRTTGIGHGIAIPHGKIGCCDHLCMAIGKADPPIEFGAIDGKPVELIILLASPIDQTGPHIQALASVSRMLTDTDIRAAMHSARTPEQVYELIADQEARAAV